jgi:hypothetical protein
MPSPQKVVETLLALALEKPLDKRTAFLDATCEGDPVLRQSLALASMGKALLAQRTNFKYLWLATCLRIHPTSASV